MDTEPPRLIILFSAVAGATFWGLFHLSTALWAGQPVSRQDVIKAVATVIAGLLAGMLAAWFLGPALTPLVPVIGLRDPHVVGFAIGAVSWELAPFAFRFVRDRGSNFGREKQG